MGVQRAGLLNADDAARVSETVNRLRGEWVARDAHALHTLGAAAYLDAPTDETLARFGIAAPPENAYMAAVDAGNTLLRRHFDPLHDRLLETLRTLLDADVVYAPGKALPGFHVFEEHPHYASPAAHTAHFDRQYEALDWGSAVSVGSASTISFTLPIKLPLAGAGLLLWGVELETVLASGPDASADIIRSAPRWREQYTVGELVVHPGHLLHRIAPWRSQPCDQRITLQGHALQVEGRWLAYW